MAIVEQPLDTHGSLNARIGIVEDSPPGNGSYGHRHSHPPEGLGEDRRIEVCRGSALAEHERRIGHSRLRQLLDV